MAVEDEDHDDIVGELVAQLAAAYSLAKAYVDDAPYHSPSNRVLEQTREVLNKHGVKV
jgi:hypothetical protein